MRVLRSGLLIWWALLSLGVHASSGPAEMVLRQAKIVSEDSALIRSGKILPVLADWLHKYDLYADKNFFSEPSPLSHEYRDQAKERVERLYRNYNVPLPGEAPSVSRTPYHLDSLRTADQMLSDQIGGSCGTHGLTLASLLVKSGIPKDHIRIVGSVYDKDYLDICPQAGKSRREISSSANGHIFVAVKEGSRWKLINSTSRTLEAIDIPDPNVLESRMSKGQPYAIPNQFASLQAIPDPNVREALTRMILFNVWDVDSYPVHSFPDRLDMVASGKAGNKNCRFSPEDVKGVMLTKSPTLEPTPQEGAVSEE